jgi:4-hydroxybenzoate polyprenyltransferase
LWVGILKAVRFPNLLMLALAQYIVACSLTVPNSRWFGMLTDPALFRLVSATLFIAAGGYLINDYYDIKIDYINRPKRVIIGRELKRREVIFIHPLLSLSGVGLGFTVSWQVGVVCLGSAFLLWLYSNQLKRLPLVGNIMVAFLTWMSIAVVGLQFRGNVWLIVAYAGFAALTTLIREIVKDVEDMRGDMHFGCKTLPILVGVARTKLVLLPLIILLLLVLWIMAAKVAPQGLEYVFYCLILLVLFGLIKLLRADSRRHFSWLSSYWKVIMLVGVLSMLLF